MVWVGQIALSRLAGQVQNTVGDGWQAGAASDGENTVLAVAAAVLWQNVRAVSYYMSYIRLVEVQ
jgi:hypothetical protein